MVDARNDVFRFKDDYEVAIPMPLPVVSSINLWPTHFMNDETQTCPKCQSPYAYPDQGLWVCPECFHEWSLEVASAEESEKSAGFIDANGVPLQSGDTVRVVKDLKVGSNTIKSGTKVKSIRLLDDPVDGHDISCKIDGMGAVYLKCSVVRKE